MTAETSLDPRVGDRLEGANAPGLARALLWMFVYFGLPGVVMALHPSPAGAAGWTLRAVACVVALALVLMSAKAALPGSELEDALMGRRPDVRGITLTLLLAPIAISLDLGVTSLLFRVMQPDDLGDDLLASLWRTEGRAAAILAGFVMVVVGPVMEEILFRGVMLTCFTRRYGPRAALVLSSLLFAMAHHPLAWGGTFTLGLLLGWWVQRTGTLAYTIGLHVAWNALIGELLPASISEDPATLPLLVVIGLLALGVLGLRMLAAVAPRADPKDGRGSWRSTRS